MIGLTGLVDTQLATKLAQRLDLLALKTEVQIDGPGPAIQVEKVVNNVGLLSRAALDRQVLAGAPALAQPAAAQLPAVELSEAARAISAALTDFQSTAEPVRGTSPLVSLRSLQPLLQAPSAAALAVTLAQTVSNSGLFYESHLLQFANGSRSLALMAQEPQARWALPRLATIVETSNALPVPAELLLRGALQPGLPAHTEVNEVNEESDKSAATFSARAAVPPPPANPHTDAARLLAAYQWAHAASAGRALMPLEAAPVQRAGDGSDPAGSVAIPGVVSVPPVAEVSQPQASALLHQQLDLLASAVFRWSGEASPGVAMEWSIQEEQADQHADTPDEDRPQRWATTLSLTLPRLGVVDIRLSLNGPIVQAHLVASEPATLARLQADGGELAQRLETAGLSLQTLQVTAMSPP